MAAEDTAKAPILFLHRVFGRPSLLEPWTRLFEDAGYPVHAPTLPGRDPATTTLTGWARVAPSPDGRLDADREDTIAGTPAAIAERLEAIHEAGIAHLTCFIGDEDDGHQYPALTAAALDRFAPILQQLRQPAA